MPSKLGPCCPCRQVSERALSVLRGLVAKHSNVRAKIGLPDNLMAAANFQAALHRSWHPEARSAPRTGAQPGTAANQAKDSRMHCLLHSTATAGAASSVLCWGNAGCAQQHLSATKVYKFQMPAPLHTILLVPAGASQEVILGFKSLYSSLVQPDRTFKVSFLKALLHPFTAASDLNTSGASRSDTRSAACSCCWSIAFRVMPASSWH